RRRNNYDCINLKKSVERFFTNLQDVTLNGIEKPISKYVDYVWKNLTLNDYISLLKKEPNRNVENHDMYKNYCNKLNFKSEKDFWNAIIDLEKEKLFYFILGFPQKIVWIKTGEKEAEKRFLGYEFSERRGHEGIHAIQRDSTISQCTKLFDEDVFDNPLKASAYIYKAFSNEFIPIDESLKDNITNVNLLDTLNFTNEYFDYQIICKSVNEIPQIMSKWNFEELSSIANIIRGVTYSKNEQVEKSNTIILTADNITLDGKIKVTKQVFLNENYKVGTEKKLRKNDVFMCFSSGSKKHLGKVALIENNTNYFAGGFMGIIRVNENIKAKYLYYLLNTLLRETVIAMGTGSNINNLSSVVNSLKIPVPSMEIQKIIVAGIEELEEKAKTIVVADFDNEIEKILKKYLQ
ncbi:MAG: restriction endonuclease subunit S, partial [Flavobacteriaceae bacterium]|nr:restriction endonuclease subunit S [Flavobacteriaceae bacterium]